MSIRQAVDPEPAISTLSAGVGTDTGVGEDAASKGTLDWAYPPLILDRVEIPGRLVARGGPIGWIERFDRLAASAAIGA